MYLSAAWMSKNMNEKILVVDDERELADLLEVYLKNDGYTTYKYYNGRDALKGDRGEYT